MMVTLGTISGKQGKKWMQIMCYTTILFFLGLFIFWGVFSARRVFNRACMIILDGYPHFHLLVLYITCFVIFPLHFPVLSIQCFMLFFRLSSSLYYHSLSLFSLSLCCCELTFPCPAGVVVPRSERELLRKHLRLPTSFWLCSFPIFATGPLKSWMKNDNI